MNNEYNILRPLSKRTKVFNLRQYNYMNKVYVDVTPLVVDVGGSYDACNDFRVTGDRSIKELGGKF